VLHKVTTGESAIGDHERAKRPNEMKIMTSLNHVVHFHAHEGFRADEHVYIEAMTPWAKDGRAMIHSKIFSHRGLLIATCVQEVSAQKTNKTYHSAKLLTGCTGILRLQRRRKALIFALHLYSD